jgi:butyrate kinase
MSKLESLIRQSEIIRLANRKPFDWETLDRHLEKKEEELDRKNDFYGEYTLGKRRMIAERTMAMEPWNAVAMRGGAMQ